MTVYFNGEPEPAEPNEAEKERAHHFYIRGKKDLQTVLDGLAYLQKELDIEIQRTSMELVKAVLRDEYRRAKSLRTRVKATLEAMEELE